jgi:hypothetical protein
MLHDRLVNHLLREGLGDKRRADRKIAELRLRSAGGDHDGNVRPLLGDFLGKLEAVYLARGLDICEK